MHRPRPDSVYIEYLSSKPLPSCKVLDKIYSDGEYSGALYQLDSTDFNKVLQRVLSNEIVRKTEKQLYPKAAELLHKKQLQPSDLDSVYSAGAKVTIGFKHPDLIIYFINSQ